MEQTGQLIRKYAHSRSLMFVWMFFATIVGGVGFFILSLITHIGKTLHFNGNISILYAAGYGAIVIAASIVLITIIAIKSQPVFYVYENAIRSTGKHGDKTDFFADIEDLFIFLMGGFGYRTSCNSPWIFVGGRISGYGELTQKFRELHVKHRGDQLFKELMEGKTVIFHYISDEDARSKSNFASRNLNYPTFNIELTQYHLRIKDSVIPVHRIKDIKSNYWIEKSEIIDVEGNLFHKMHPAAVISFDVLYDLLARLQESTANISR
jgi:hypothetical protein